jgi:transcriptional regulator GlxA family with amidase domain
MGAIDSGALILARLGLLDGLSATTYPTIMHELEAMGVRSEMQALVVHGNIATAGGCLATLDLCAWMVERLIGADAAAKVRASFAPNS